MRKTVHFVKYYDKSSTAIGADQMADGLRRLGVDARSIYASELPGIRDSILVFVKRGNWPHLLRSRFTGNRCVLDVQDQVVFRGYISHWPGYDAFIFRTERQHRDFGRRTRRMGNLWARHATIYQHWDPRYGPNTAPEGELRVAYLGSRRSLAFWDDLPEVELVDDDYFERAPGFNVHLSIRATRKGWRYKPGAKVVTAAACDAVLLTTPDDASVELLGEDYPFYIGEASREGIQATIARAREALGGPAWRAALARMREIKEAHSLERVAERYLRLFDEIA